MAEALRATRSFGWTISLLSGASAAALTAIAPAIAADSPVLDTITVTAQKREENQQDVPISVATLGAERVQAIQAGGEDILAYAARVPSLYAESSNGRLAPRFYIRGLGNVDFDVAASQPVSIIMDEVVLENVVLKSSPIFDVEQVEVSRGPQGTLFGRNTPAGIVKFTTVKPSDEFDAFAQVAYGTYNTVTAQGAVGGPIIPGVLSARLSGLVQRRDDWVDNGFTGEDDVMGGYRELAGRIQVLYTPTEQLSALLNFHIRSIEGTSALFRANILEKGTGDLVPGNYDRDTVFYDGGDNNPQESDGWGASAKIDYDFGGAVLTSITAFETADSMSRGDIDGGYVGPNSFFNPAMPPAPPYFPDTIPFPSDTQDSVDDLDQFTQEIRLASDGGGPLRWQLGFYYFDSDLLVSTVGDGFPPLTTLRHKNKSWAVFGQASYDLTDQWTLTGGLRYTDDERDFEAVVLPPLVTVNPTSADDEDVSWDVSLLYKASDNLNLYARVARGFRGPTIQGRDVAFAAFSGAVDPQTVATSETILSYEAGFKSQFLENRARVNVAGYYYTVDDQQFSIIGGAGNVNQVINADKGVGWGFEADMEFLLSEYFFVAAGFSYNNTEIKDDALATAPCGSGLCTVLDPLNGFGQAMIDGNPFPNAPELTFNALAEFSYPMFGGEVFANTDWAVQGKTNLFLYESAEFQTSGNFEGGVRLGYRGADGRYEAAVFARNVTNEHNVKGGIDFNNLTGFVNEPRIVGVQLTVRN
ncbi:MAG: TonB-dependent receptor [Pseudomonadota bacterium]|nr:TonB-dependent receptor [Pseudomonadota bacterium]